MWVYKKTRFACSDSILFRAFQGLLVSWGYATECSFFPWAFLRYQQALFRKANTKLHYECNACPRYCLGLGSLFRRCMFLCL